MIGSLAAALALFSSLHGLAVEQERYGSFTQGIGLKIEDNTCSLEDCEVSCLYMFVFYTEF